MIGVVGEVHPAQLRKIEIGQPVIFAELSFQDLFQVRGDDPMMEPLAAFPGSTRDWTLTLKEESGVATVLDAIHGLPSKLLESVAVRDVYRSDKLGKGLKNITLRLSYRSRKKTVAQESVDKEHARIVEGTVERLKNLDCGPITG